MTLKSIPYGDNTSRTPSIEDMERRIMTSTNPSVSRHAAQTVISSIRAEIGRLEGENSRLRSRLATRTVDRLKKGVVM